MDPTHRTSNNSAANSAASANQTYPNPNELIHAILHGNITKGFPEPPSRVVKVFISSTKTDFEGERQHLHEVVIPKLERYCNMLSLDLLVIDPHWQLQPAPTFSNEPTNQASLSGNRPDVVCGTGPKLSTDSNKSPQIAKQQSQASAPKSLLTNQSSISHQSCTSANSGANSSNITPIIYDCNSNCINPHEFDLQLKEIEQCSRQSAAIFFMCLVGHKYRTLALPTVIPSNDFQQIFTAAAESGLGDVNLLRSCYKENRNLQPAPQYVLLEPRRASRQYEEDLEHIAKLVEYGSKVAAREGLLSDRFGTVMSAVHQQTLYALDCARQCAAGNANSPTTRNFQGSSGHAVNNVSSSLSRSHHSQFASSAVTTANSIRPQHHHHQHHHNISSSSIGKPLSAIYSNSTVTPSGDLAPLANRKTKTTHRLMHQASLQQGPTQQKISMPRQSSVSTNYTLMQPPVDQMLCFIRQFEGVNFNNVCISRFFDVTPTITTSGDESNNNANAVQQLGSNNILAPGQTLTQQSKALFAPSAQSDIQQLIEDVILGLKKGNVHYFNISWCPPENSSLQTRTYTLPEHYIERFGETVLRTLKTSVDNHLSSAQNSLFGSSGANPAGNFEYPAEIVREAHSHLSNFRRVMGALGMAQAIESDFAHLLHIRELLDNTKIDDRRGARHQPIIVTGRQGSGKSTLLAQVFTYAPEWLAENSDRDLVIRIVRQCGQSLSSNFASELLRSLCLQIAIAYGLDSQLTRSAEAHELSELAICFQELLKLIETTPGANSSDLLIILDDLHLLQSALQSSALLGWMPWNLPPNVHFICSVALEADSVLSILRSRISSDNFIRFDEFECSTNSSNAEKELQKIAKSKTIFSMVQCKLRDEKRTLTNTQWDFVRQKLKIVKYPTAAEQLSSANKENNNNKPIDSQQSSPQTPDLLYSHQQQQSPPPPSQYQQQPPQSTIAPEEMTPLFANMLATSVLSNWESFYVPDYMPTNVEEIVSTILDDIEECIPYALVRRICSYLTCTKYGLREAELYNLVQETLTCQVWPTMVNLSRIQDSGTPDPSEYPRSTASTWLLMKAKMKNLLREYYVQGRLYFNWRSPKVARAVRDRYLIDIQQIRATHQELATAFYASFNEVQQSNTAHGRNKETDSVREADELWYHLLYSGNKEQLKSYALLNIRFLMAIVEGVSVCYLRCILDAVRSQILDWDIEQLYGMLKQSVHVVTHDPNQLPVEAVLWLVPFICQSPNSSTSLNQLLVSNQSNSVQSKSGSIATNSTISSVTGAHSSPNISSYLEEFVRQSYRLCQEHKGPLLYPNSIWLNLPVPPQVAMITCPWASITRAVATPDSQSLIVCEGRMLHFYHLPTKTIVKTIEGHKSTITCLHLASSGKWLATGSNDNSVNLWQIDAVLMENNECRLRYRFNHHVAGVLCVTINHAETLVLSGSEVGAICAVNLRNGTLISRLEHHRGMVTCLGINSGDDVLVSGSTDRTIVVWSMETFCILNEILLMRPILHMDISLDSTFLLLSMDDNSLQIRALTTGTAVHTLQAQNTSSNQTSVVSYVRFAEDNCRCVIGYADGRLLLFDTHSARQLQTLNGHSEMISAILPQKDDHFLITCGGNKIIIWNFYPVKRVDQAIDPGTSDSNLDGIQSGNFSAIGTLQSGDSIGGDMLSGQAGSGSGSAGIGIGGAGSGGSSGFSSDNTKVVGTSGRSSRSSSDRRKHKPSGTIKKKTSIANIENHREPITCVAVSRDGQYMVTGGRDCLVKIWSTSTGDAHTTLDEHSAPITCVDIASNSQFVVSGSEDGSIQTWSITMSLYLSKFNEHHLTPIVAVKIMSDSKRVLSADVNGVQRLWHADSGVQLRSIQNKPINGLTLHGNQVMAIGGKIDNCLKYWSCYEPELEKSVSHSDTITCFTCTYSGKTIITGSQDMSLKVWEASTAKLTQVLVGHDGAISCVATAALNEMLVVSGAQDCNLIVWDMSTGTDLFTLAEHNANIMGVILTPDGSRALSYSEDNTLQLWDIKETGQRLSILDIHRNFSRVYSSLNLSYLAIWLGGNSHLLPIIKHHNNPAHSIVVELPPAGTPVNVANEEKTSAWLRGLVPRNATALAARTLKREQSFDSFYFEHMLHRGQSVDDFRKIGAFNNIGAQSGVAASGLSPFGSREQLWKNNDPSNLVPTTTTTAASSTRNRMISKLMNIGPKQKMLKKQQSMFACFPEFTGKQPSASAGTTSTAVTSSGIDLISSISQVNGSKKIVQKMFTPSRASSHGPVLRAHSMENEDDSHTTGDLHHHQHSSSIKSSSIGRQQLDSTNSNLSSNGNAPSSTSTAGNDDVDGNASLAMQIAVSDSSVCVVM